MTTTFEEGGRRLCLTTKINITLLTQAYVKYFSRNHPDKYFEKIKKKNLIELFKKFEEQSQKLKKKNFRKF